MRLTWKSQCTVTGMLAILSFGTLYTVPIAAQTDCTPTQESTASAPSANLKAYWIDQNTLPINNAKYDSSYTYTLWYDPNAGISETVGQSFVTPGGTAESLPLTYGGTLSSAQQTQYPQIASYDYLTWANGTPSAATLQAILQSQIEIVGVDRSNVVQYYTGVQDAGVIDTLYDFTGTLGNIYTGSGAGGITVKLWAPTAQAVTLYIYTNENDAITSPVATESLTENATNGVWSGSINGDRETHYYLYKVTVYNPVQGAVITTYTTDPYSTDLAPNSIKSRFTNLADTTLNYPTVNGINWANDQSPSLSSIAKLSIYELHVRDFSSYSGTPGATADPNLPTAHIGTYLAFTDAQSYGMTHLAALAAAGLKAVHLLPTNQFASYESTDCPSPMTSCTYNMNDESSMWQTPSDYSSFPSYSATSCDASNAIWNVRWADDYDWGYGPVDFMAPEGGYASNPDNRVNEYREMVMGLHQAGLRVIQDVVFNHTDSTENAVVGLPPSLDAIVPAYYYRLDTSGNYENHTCTNCFDTATEHLMMEKLMIDTVSLMATQYHIDGFRFDIMSALTKKAMKDLQVAISGLTLTNGDPWQIYLYGEGFPFGSVDGTNANVTTLAGTGIGAFNNRAKYGDVAPEDGCSWDTSGTGCLQQQAFATGLYTNSNSETNAYPPTLGAETQLLQYSDFIRCGLTGNLADFSFTDYTGTTRTCAQMPYPFDSVNQIGYTNDPTEAVNDPGDHDGLVLFDSVELKSPADEDFDSRTRRQILAMSVMALGQGIPFFVAGEDGMHSRSLDHSSGNSGDWFNRIDWSFNTNNWGVGLPRENSSSQADWTPMAAVVTNSNSTPIESDIQLTSNVFQELLQIRDSSGLFHMAKAPFGCNSGYPSGNPNYCNSAQNNPNSGGGVSANAQTIISNLTFLNTGTSQVPGLIVMKLDNNTGGSYGQYTHIVVVFNGTLTKQTYTDSALKNLQTMALDPIQVNGADSVVKTSTISSNGTSGTVTVPGLTTAVFVE